MTREEEIFETAKFIYSPSSSSDIPLSLSMRVGFIEGAKWADEHPNLSEEEQVGMGELGVIWKKKALLKKICNWLKSQVSMDWNKLKKAITEAASVFGGLILLITCVAGIDYIALTHPIVAIFIAVVILFCLLIVMFYLIS